MANNFKNYKPIELLESYEANYKRSYTKNGSIYYDEAIIPFKYSDGTSDSYVKRGYDEERIQAITRRLGLESAYRIFTTNLIIDFKPNDKVIIGDDEKKIIKVLPLMNTNDTLRMYNFTPSKYREMAVKLIYLQ